MKTIVNSAIYCCYLLLLLMLPMACNNDFILGIKDHLDCADKKALAEKAKTALDEAKSQEATARENVKSKALALGGVVSGGAAAALAAAKLFKPPFLAPIPVLFAAAIVGLAVYTGVYLIAENAVKSAQADYKQKRQARETKQSEYETKQNAYNDCKKEACPTETCIHLSNTLSLLNEQISILEGTSSHLSNLLETLRTTLKDAESRKSEAELLLNSAKEYNKSVKEGEEKLDPSIPEKELEEAKNSIKFIKSLINETELDLKNTMDQLIQKRGEKANIESQLQQCVP